MNAEKKERARAGMVLSQIMGSDAVQDSWSRFRSRPTTKNLKAVKDLVTQTLGRFGFLCPVKFYHKMPGRPDREVMAVWEGTRKTVPFSVAVMVDYLVCREGRDDGTFVPRRRGYVVHKNRFGSTITSPTDEEVLEWVPMEGD